MVEWIMPGYMFIGFLAGICLCFLAAYFGYDFQETRRKAPLTWRKMMQGLGDSSQKIPDFFSQVPEVWQEFRKWLNKPRPFTWVAFVTAYFFNPWLIPSLHYSADVLTPADFTVVSIILPPVIIFVTTFFWGTLISILASIAVKKRKIFWKGEFQPYGDKSIAELKEKGFEEIFLISPSIYGLMLEGFWILIKANFLFFSSGSLKRNRIIYTFPYQNDP